MTSSELVLGLNWVLTKLVPIPVDSYGIDVQLRPIGRTLPMTTSITVALPITIVPSIDIICGHGTTTTICYFACPLFRNMEWPSNADTVLGKSWRIWFVQMWVKRTAWEISIPCGEWLWYGNIFIAVDHIFSQRSVLAVFVLGVLLTHAGYWDSAIGVRMDYEQWNKVTTKQTTRFSRKQ